MIAAGEKSIFMETQRAWLGKAMYLTIVPTIKDVAHRLLDQDYLAVVIFTDNLSSVSPSFADIRRIKPNIPILFMPSERGKTPGEITRQLESVVETVELDRTEQQAVPEESNAWPDSQPLTCRDLSIYPQFRIVLFHGREVKLSRCQFDALTALMESRGRLLTFDQLYDRVYGEFTEAGNAYGSTRYFIAEIRRRLSEIAAFDYIENVRGVGYRMRYVHK
ncbi:winged helix-turn-helix domain-containing protein [Harryflintia acetispora]|uniref:winged helix-turn-helix domain-containing protein n=1 Tax=Harryflintia acetispora TaxID=1849041 RepID=UPI001899F454|nr:winged helix-turn-helix domain-containing protein [Harryflintia acetispora]